MARGRGQLGICPLRARDASCYENAADLMRRAIGEPLMVDTSEEQLVGRIFGNRTIKVYPKFADFFGAEGGH